MDRGTPSINLTPSNADEEIGVEMSSCSAHQLEHKYHYDFGFKAKGDELIDFKKNEYVWDSPQNIELILPCNAAAKQRISFVEIKVDQSSVAHDAKIIDGGIGSDHIKILVTTRYTNWLKYEMRIFGNAGNFESTEVPTKWDGIKWKASKLN